MDPFVYDLSASFAAGGAWVALASMAAQRFGGKVGGFIAGLPATSVLAIFFITRTEGARHGFDLTGVFPLTISVNAVFLTAYAAFSRKSFLAGLTTSLIVWAGAQACLSLWHPQPFGRVLAMGAAVFAASFVLVSRLDIPDPSVRQVRHGIREITIRAGAGGLIVVCAMLGSRYGGPLLGGILSAFPATVVATLVITAGYGGRDLTRTMARPMMVSGVINCMVFALAYRHVVLQMDPVSALALAYGITLVSASGTFWWVNLYHRPHAHALHA